MGPNDLPARGHLLGLTTEVDVGLSEVAGYDE